MSSESEDFVHLVVNVEETIGKTVGRRKPKVALDPTTSTKASAERWRASFGGIGVPRGVFRFNSHEEADKWMMTKIVESAVRKS